MDRHICKYCKRVFSYCRACVFKPIPYKAAGFCSPECSAADKAASKIEEVIPTEDVEVVVIEEDTSTPKEDALEYPYFFTATEEVKEDVIVATSEATTPKKRKRKTINEAIEENEINDKEQDYRETV